MSPELNQHVAVAARLSLDRSFGVSSLPMSAALASALRDVLEPAVPGMFDPAWHYLDRILAWLIPSLRLDIAAFYVNDGPPLVAEFNSLQLASIDRALVALIGQASHARSPGSIDALITAASTARRA